MATKDTAQPAIQIKNILLFQNKSKHNILRKQRPTQRNICKDATINTNDDE